jgi:ABC-type multidrug transport system fused ATPase/permease subunit
MTIQGNPDDPPEKILEAVYAAAIAGFNQKYPGFVAHPFGALLVRLSRDAEKTARTIRRLTWVIAGLTFVLVALTVVLVWLTVELIEQENETPPATGQALLVVKAPTARS